MRSGNTVGRLIAHSDALRGRREHQRADEMLAEAALAHPADASDLLSTLRRNLRTGLADRVVELLSHAPIDQRSAVARALVEAHIEPDATTLLDTICGAADDAEIVQALVIFDAPSTAGAWRPGSERPDAVEVLCARLLSLSSERYARLLLRLFGDGFAGTGDRLVGHLAARWPLWAVDLAVVFVVSGHGHVSRALVDNVVERAAPNAVAEILSRLSGEIDGAREVDALLAAALIRRPDPHAVFQGLRFVGAAALAERFLDLIAANAPAPTVAALLDGLLADGAQADVERIVVRAAARTDRAEFCENLHRAARHRFAYLIAEQR